MEVYWLEQSEADVPAGDDWLSASELTQLSTFRFAKRRSDWQLGRWTAKSALALYLNAPADPRIFASLEIRPALSGAPTVFFQNRPAAAAISLSHRAGIAACAVTRSDGVLGCDLELIEPHSGAFLTDYFTTEEQSFVLRTCSDDRPRLLTLLWSAKESALKALHAGLRLDTRTVTVGPFDALRGEREDAKEREGTRTALVRSLDGHFGWSPLQVCSAEGQVFNGWWQRSGDLIRTMVALPPPEPPIPFEKIACFN